MSDQAPEQRRLSADERARLRDGVFAAIDREERTRRRRRRALGAGVVAAAVLVLALTALRAPDPPTTDTAGSMTVRCTAAGDDAAPDGLVTVSARHDPRLVCAEIWRRGELVGGTRKSAPLTACARAEAREVLVMVTSDAGGVCGATTSETGSTSQQ